jgi:hypothetical protein
LNVSRVVLAAVGGMIAYFGLGGLLLAVLPLADEFAKYAAVYRPQETMEAVAPVGGVALLVAMCALAILYARAYREEPPLLQGLRFGLLVGVFASGSFMLHNYVAL